MVSILFRTDVHAADHGPVSWKGDYRAEIMSSLRQVGEIARDRKVDAVVDGGDFFSVKAASRNSHSLVRESIQIHRSYPCPTYLIEGNHDLQYNNIETLEKQPLGVLFEAGIFQRLREVTLERDGVSVRIVGFPFSLSRSLEDFQSLSRREGEYLVAVSHALATMSPGGPADGFIGETIFGYRDLLFAGAPDIWAWGHWHKDQGITSLTGEDGREIQFVNQGALSRGALTHDNLTRIPRVALFKFEQGQPPEVEFIDLEVAAASEVFDLERKEVQVHRSKVIEDFVSNLMAEGTLDSEASVEDSVRKLDFATEVRDGALEYLERVRSARSS